MSTTISDATSAVTASSTTATGSSNTLGQDAFLQMLIAQLKHQDPLNPMDGTQFVAQLAQFSSLEQLQNLNTNMSSLPTYLNTFSNSQMANLIGKEAVASGDVINVSGSTTAIKYNLPSDIQSGSIQIYNSSGVLVDTVQIGSQEAGMQNVTWNSSDQDAGGYTFEVNATDKSGNEVTAETLISGAITGVTFNNGETYLVINGQEVAFSNVVRISESNS